MLYATTQVHLCCRVCNGADYFCPTCGAHHTLGAPEQFTVPSATAALCPCGTFITLQVIGYTPNPTGDSPVTESPLSDKLPSLTKALQQPAAARPASKPAKASKATITSDQRFTLAQWQAMGARLPRRYPPASISAAYRRLFDRNPLKQKQTCLYSAAEMTELHAYFTGQG
jgi:hypothetical protein